MEKHINNAVEYKDIGTLLELEEVSKFVSRAVAELLEKEPCPAWHMAMIYTIQTDKLLSKTIVAMKMILENDLNLKK